MLQRPQIHFQRPVIGCGRRRGLMLVLSSPSGAGKTTISRKLIQMDTSFTLSVSATTRARRPNEVDGADYYFTSEPAFQDMIRNGEFLEYAKVFDNYYGTPREPVERSLAEGRDVLFDIDWQGHRQLLESARDDVVSIFILPPSQEALHRRLISRGQDSEEVINRRMAKAPDEISHWTDYDYVLVNEDLQETTATVQGIIEVERLRRRRQVGLADFVKRLLETA